MKNNKYYICADTLPDEPYSCIVTTNYDLYEKFKDGMPNLECLSFYQDKAVHAEWIRKIDDYALNMGLLLKYQDKREYAGRLCGNVLWNVLNKFVCRIIGLHVFLKQNKGDFMIGHDIHPILAMIFKEMITSFGGSVVMNPTVDIASCDFPPPHQLVHRRISHLLNKVKRPKKRGGVIFHRYRPAIELVDHLLQKGIPVNIVNPSKKYLRYGVFNRSIAFFFTSISRKSCRYEFEDVSFTVGDVDVSETTSAVARNILESYLAGYEMMFREIDEWIRSAEPLLAVIGESESPIAYSIHECCKSLGCKVMHIPHGLVAPLDKGRVIDGFDNADAVLNHWKCNNNPVITNTVFLKVIHPSTSHSPVSNVVFKRRRDKRLVLVLEHNLFEQLSGESEMWIFRSASDVIGTHLNRFPDRRVCFRMRPTIFAQKAIKGTDHCSTHIDNHGNKDIFGKDYFVEGYYKNEQSRLIRYLRSKFSPDELEFDTSASFVEAASNVDYVIGNMSTCFREAMQLRVPYYCYNPGKLDYPFPVDGHEKYVFDNIDDMLDSVDNVSFDDVFDDFHFEINNEAVVRDYILAGMRPQYVRNKRLIRRLCHERSVERT